MDEIWSFDYKNYIADDNAVFTNTASNVGYHESNVETVPDKITLLTINRDNIDTLSFKTGKKYPNYPLTNGSTSTTLKNLLDTKSGDFTITITNIPSQEVNAGVSDPIYSHYLKSVEKSGAGRRRRRRNSKFSRNVSKKMKGLRSLFNTRKWTLKRKIR